MAMPDSFEANQDRDETPTSPESDASETAAPQSIPAEQDETFEATAPGEGTPANSSKASSKRARRANPAKVAANLHRVRLTTAGVDETVPAAATISSADTTEPEAAVPAAGTSGRWQWRRKGRRDRLQDWDKWSKFRLWRRTRPLWGSILMILSSFVLLALPLSLLPFAAFLPDSFGLALIVGGLLFIMALAQLLVPSYSLLTGSIGILLSLVSLITSTFGGLLLGMILGIIGGALSVSWRPVKRARLAATRSTN